MSKAVRIAERIQQDLVQGRVKPGEVLGSEHDLRIRFAVGRETLREAITILEMRGIGRMRRGRRGGFVVGIPDVLLVARSFSGHALLMGTTAPQLAQARGILERIAAPEVPADSPPPGRKCASDHTKVIVDALVHSMSTLQEHFRGDTRSYMPHQPTQRITVGARRAGQIARNIVAQLAQTPLAPGEVRFGSERDLSHRFSISKAIARQVVRLLEDLNVARSQRGSGHGIFVNPPTVHRPAETIGLYLLTHASTPESSWEIAQMLRIECAQLAASHRFNVREPACGGVSTALQQLSDGNRPYDLEALFLIDRAVESTSGNPLLTLILEGLKAYSALAQPLRDRRLARFIGDHGERYLELTHEVLTAIKRGDPQAAGQAQRHMNRFFTDHVCCATTGESREPV